MTKTFTTLEIETIAQVAKEYASIQDELNKYCRLVAYNLNYNSIESIVIFDGAISFVAIWDGPYQSTDRNFIEFPLEWLTKYPSEVAKVLREQKEEEKARMNAVKEKVAKGTKYQQYLDLKKEFEPNG